MVWQRKVLGMKLEMIARNLCVDTSTVQRVVSKFDATGQVKKKNYSSQNKILKLSKPVQLTILQPKPDMYLWEMKQELKFLFHLDVCESSICKFLRKSNFSRKELQLIAAQCDTELRALCQ